MKRVTLLVFACVAVLATEPDARESNAETISTAEGNYYPRPEVHRSRHDDPRHHSHRHDHRDYKDIIEHVYSPDYYEPTLVLDYRYLKSGGRDYVRGPGGQIIVLPKGIHNPEPKEFPDYDHLLEHLRHKNPERAYQEVDVSRPNHRDGHRPWFNQIDDYPHGHHQHWH